MSQGPKKSVEQLQKEFEEKVQNEEYMSRAHGFIPRFSGGKGIATYSVAGMFFSVRMMSQTQYELTTSDSCNEKTYTKNIPYKERSNCVDWTEFIKQNTRQGKSFLDDL